MRLPSPGEKRESDTHALPMLSTHADWFFLLFLAAFGGLAVAPAAVPQKEPAPEPPACKAPTSLDDLATLADKPKLLSYAEPFGPKIASKPRGKGGLGFGRPGNADGIESQFLQRLPPMAATLKAKQKDLIRMPRQVVAVNEVTRLFFEGPAQGKGT